MVAIARSLGQRLTTRACSKSLVGASWRRWQSTDTRKWSTPLAKSLAEAITTTGPIPVAAYMRQCLTDAEHGYYTRIQKDAVKGDQFGRKGDFITSPEISQIFGELVGLWIVAEWMAQELKGRAVHLLEVGPGRGTLMDDVLRTLQNFKELAGSIEKIHLVEASKPLREAQHKLLCGETRLEEIDGTYRSRSRYLPNPEVIWYEDMKFVPSDSDSVPFIIAHEFFDALPIHIFQSVEAPVMASPLITTTATQASIEPPQKKEKEWREMLVNPISPLDALVNTRSKPGTPKPDFELIVSQKPTPHSQLLPRINDRYQKLLPHTGSVIEISPESLGLAGDFASRIGGTAKSPKPNPVGAALILDYGPAATIPTNSLRGIRAHQSVSPFASAGLVDLSADVDFLALAHAALDTSPGVEVHGPVEQASFLGAMGSKERAEVLIKKAGGDEETASRIKKSWTRLVDRGPDGMGKTYKALAILPYDARKEMRRPVGFGGIVKT